MLDYQLQGSLENLSLLPESPVAARAHELWRHTCFELFFAAQGGSAESAESVYWEVNLSPSGCWNVYRFDHYRSGMREEVLASRRFWQLTREAELLSLTCAFDIGELIDNSSGIVAGLSVVLASTDGGYSFWAINHFGTRPDFHNRQSFLLQLPGCKQLSSNGDRDAKRGTAYPK